MKYSLFIIRWMFVLAAAMFVSSCTEDDTQSADHQYGYVQFHLTKNTTRAEQLDYLSAVCKVRVNLTAADGNMLSQTLNVSAHDNVTAELGMQSEKWMLMSGSYKVVSYELFDQLEASLMLLTYPIQEQPVMTVVPRGLALHELQVKVMGRGTAKFRLVKDNAIGKPRITAEGVKKHPFHMIVWADVTVQNLETNEETTFKKLKTQYQTVPDDDNKEHTTGVSICDSLCSLPAGPYRVVAFDTYFDKGQSPILAEHCKSVVENKFVVVDSRTITADVPVTLDDAADYVKDAYALREIWYALNGPNWSYKGPTYPKGSNWEFENRDVDLWLAQPGVQVLENGRIAVLILDGFGAKGAMPAALGQLTELRQLTLGTHNSDPEFSGPIAPSFADRVVNEVQIEQQIESLRKSFMETYVKNGHPLECFSEEMQTAFELNNIHYEKSARPLLNLPMNATNHYVTEITSLPQEIGQLKKLQSLYIAFGAITDLPAGLTGCEALSDIEIFSCNDLEIFPPALAELPKLTMLIFSCNKGVSSDEMIKGLQTMNAKAESITPKGTRLQVLQMPGQPLQYLPDLTKLKELSLLNIQQCGVERIEKAFGKNHYFVSFLASSNKIEELPVDEFGYFVGLHTEFEGINFSRNEFTAFPNIFNAQSIFKVGSIDFSLNKIDRFQGAEDGTWRGVNVKILSLGYNKLKEFPEVFYTEDKTCSLIDFLQLQGNGIEKISEGSLVGDNTFLLTSIDLSMNKIKELPWTFNARTFPYLFGLDLSYNRFDQFQTRPLNSASLTTYIFRGQRDEKGNRIMTEWPQGIGQHKGLRVLLLGSNDIRKVKDTRLSFLIMSLELNDNPNITIDVSDLCPYIKAGRFRLGYDPTQDIRGCDALTLNN